MYSVAVIGLHQYHFVMVTEASRKPHASKSSNLVFFEICSALLMPFAFFNETLGAALPFLHVKLRLRSH